MSCQVSVQKGKRRGRISPISALTIVVGFESGSSLETEARDRT